MDCKYCAGPLQHGDHLTCINCNMAGYNDHVSKSYSWIDKMQKINNFEPLDYFDSKDTILGLQNKLGSCWIHKGYPYPKNKKIVAMTIIYIEE